MVAKIRCSFVEGLRPNQKDSLDSRNPEGAKPQYLTHGLSTEPTIIVRWRPQSRRAQPAHTVQALGGDRGHPARLVGLGSRLLLGQYGSNL